MKLAVLVLGVDEVVAFGRFVIALLLLGADGVSSQGYLVSANLLSRVFEPENALRFHNHNVIGLIAVRRSSLVQSTQQESQDQQRAHSENCMRESWPRRADR